MAGKMEQFDAVLGQIDELVGACEPAGASKLGGSVEHDIRQPLPTVLSTSHPLAQALAEATGLPTVVTEGNPGDTPLQNAVNAGRAALAHFGPARLSDQAGRAINATERGEA